MLNKDLSQGKSSSNITTFHPFPHTSISVTFNIDQVEVWGIGPQPDLEQEKKNAQPRRPNWNITSGDQADLDDIVSQIIT